MGMGKIVLTLLEAKGIVSNNQTKVGTPALPLPVV